MLLRFKINNCRRVKIYGRGVRLKTEGFTFPIFRQGIYTKKAIYLYRSLREER